MSEFHPADLHATRPHWIFITEFSDGDSVIISLGGHDDGSLILAPYGPGGRHHVFSREQARQLARILKHFARTGKLLMPMDQAHSPGNRPFDLAAWVNDWKPKSLRIGDVHYQRVEE